MIESLISALGLELGLTSKEIADVVWLALQMNEVDRPPNLVPDRPEKVRPTPQAQPTAEPSFPPSEQQERSESKPSEPQAGLYAPDDQDSASMAGALALKVPDARSMREPLSLARALKPLLRKVMTGYRMVLDETATVERIAEEGVWLPVLQPSLEPWLELALVVDESVSMQIWRRTIVELQRFMEHYGVFRDVRVWGLLTDEQGQVQIRAGMGKAAMRQGLRRPSELIDPSGRRLVLVVTDCVSPHWRDGTIQPALKLWAASGPMAIVQMLPEWLWARTGLGLASTVRFQSMAAGLANQQLRVRDLSPWDDVDVETGVKVPVVTLEPERFGAWAQMMTGKGGAWTTGVIFESGAIGMDLPLRSDDALDGEQRVQQFRVTASPMARQLAGLLASAPVISLPIVRIIQERLLKDSRQVHVAEVFLGGLLKPLIEITPETNVDSVQYEFLDGVRDVLLESMRTSETINALNEVSQFVAERLGLSIDRFMAVLRSPQQLENQELVGTARPFAIVTAQIIRQLGQEYSTFAETLELAYEQIDLLPPVKEVSNAIVDVESITTARNPSLKVSVQPKINQEIEEIQTVLGQLIAENLQADPTASLDVLVDRLKNDDRLIRINADNAKGYQTIVQEGVAYVEDHYHLDTETLKAVLDKLLKERLPVGTPNNLPRSGVAKFVSRDAELEQLHSQIQKGELVAISAIAGMGGVGKTELAIQYARAFKAAYPAGVCWLLAREMNIGTQIVSYALVELGLRVPDVIELPDQVRFCWRNWPEGETLIVLDDVTNYPEVEPYLPPENSRFKVLLTTRLKFGPPIQTLPLGVLAPEKSLELVEVLVGKERVAAELAVARSLCEWLGHLPLGLELVGRYLDSMEDLSISEMLFRLQQKAKLRRAIRDDALQRNDATATSTAKRGIEESLELSWLELDANSQHLAKLLSLFAPAPIPWYLAESVEKEYCENSKGNQEFDVKILENSKNKLLNLNLLQLSQPKEQIYCLHSLIREFFRSKLEEESDFEALNEVE